nr:immunoglobulin heavy chain junction region [Mus musculus]MBK4195221.1 immunoglobulin heavy chain junction region [Mus musculus]
CASLRPLTGTFDYW